MIPEQAIDAAAKALYASAGHAADWDNLDGPDGMAVRGTYQARARAALAAGGPSMAAQVLRDAATEIADAKGGADDGGKDYWDGYAEAIQAAESILESRAESFETTP
ncbi:hypothetical protein LVY72_22715 [Arthrobacter sp. I2-34]|uniref:Uncharacterized protein n=1 Tax=Arthrobacter hankyongi TaxID=2904801 RepID=A0ABS9LDI7_9MICC|nr:hypothetical protein [Arthrobacter hankyongi]MCG2624705.1 hypothetical protein [Arthrobacter hankyongi]